MPFPVIPSAPTKASASLRGQAPIVEGIAPLQTYSALVVVVLVAIPVAVILRRGRGRDS